MGTGSGGTGARAEAGVDPKEELIAGRLAKDLVDCDPSILSLIVVDSMGRVLHTSRSARLAPEQHVDPGLVRTFGVLAKTIAGAANNASKVMGAMEAVVGVFKQQKVLLINLREYNLLLALRLSRSSNAEYVCDRIEDLLATRGEA